MGFSRYTIGNYLLVICSERFLSIWSLRGHIIWRGLHPKKYIQNCNFLLRGKKNLQFWISHTYSPERCGEDLQLTGTHVRKEPIGKEFVSERNSTWDTVAVDTIMAILCHMMPKLFQRCFYPLGICSTTGHPLSQSVIRSPLEFKKKLPNWCAIQLGPCNSLLFLDMGVGTVLKLSN